MIGRILLTLVAAVGLSGCASLTPQQCATVDWHTLGTADAARGAYPQLDRHTRACARAGLPSDPLRYGQGYHTGLALYCRPEAVMGQALRGTGTPDICPIEIRADLLPYYRAGRGVYDAGTTLDQLTAEHRRLTGELERGQWTDERHGDLRQRLYELHYELERATQARWMAEQLLVQYQALAR